MESIISETNYFLGSYFFSKCFKFYVDSENVKKIYKIFFDLEIIAFELVALNTRFEWERILVIGCQFVRKQSQDFRYYQDRIFRDDFVSEWSRNMTETLPCRHKQCFRPCNMLTVHKCSDTRVFRHYVTPLFPVCSFRNKTPVRLIFFSNFSKFYIDFTNAEIFLRIFYDLEIIAFELVALNTRFYWQRTLVIRCQFLNKQFQEFRYY